jgi:putative Mn2+ efflux pump MntP
MKTTIFFIFSESSLGVILYYMGLMELILTATGLSMDAFAVSICKGLALRKMEWSRALLCGIWFGVFQGLMPLIGFFAGSHFAKAVSGVDHWIVFIVLSLIGGNMIREAFKPEEKHHFNPRRLRTQLLLAVATSIDALAVGISFACTGYDRLQQLLLPLTIIGVVSFLFSITGTQLGLRFGRVIARRLKPELVGGIILVVIGLKVLFSHIYGIG